MVLAILLLAALSSTDQQTSAPLSEALRARVEQLHDARTSAVRGVRLLFPDTVVHVFDARGFEPAWSATAAAEVVKAIRDIERDGLTPSDYHLTAIESGLASRTGSPSAVTDVELQLLLTDAVAAMIDHVRYGRVRPVTLDRRWNIDPRANAVPLEKLVAEVAAARSPAATIEAMKPTHFIYQGLKKALADLRTLETAGTWPSVPDGPAIKPSGSDPRVPMIRKRLAASGELAADAATDSQVYDAPLEAAVRRFQDHHRLPADGAIGKSTIQALNVSSAARVTQLKVNLERARWVVGGLSDSFVLVNLPAFKVYVIKDRKNVWEARTQIGREARQTPSFRADMKYLVFNPDWTVPPTILAQDVLGGMKKGTNPIARKKLTIIDRNGKAVDPSSIDWKTATPGNFPYTLRQPPGADNALGRVKFIFPNEYSIFLHDTPSKELFVADQRTFSSGCIRVEKPLDLAAVLLNGQDQWNPERIQQAIDAGAQKTVLLDKPLPVLIVYWTVSVGATGELRYARDVYNLDPAVARGLQTEPQSYTRIALTTTAPSSTTR